MQNSWFHPTTPLWVQNVLESNGKGGHCLSVALLLVQLLVSLQAVCFTGCRSPHAGQSTSAKAVALLEQEVLETATATHSVFLSAKWILQLWCVTASLVCPTALTRVKCSSRSFICHDYTQCVETHKETLVSFWRDWSYFSYLEDYVEHYWIWTSSCSDAVPVPFLYRPSKENQWWHGDKWGWCPDSGNAC